MLSHLHRGHAGGLAELAREVLDVPVYVRRLGGRETTFFLTGDAKYGIELLDREETDGVNDDPVGAFESVRMIKEFAWREEVVVLSSRDNEMPRFLAERGV